MQVADERRRRRAADKADEEAQRIDFRAHRRRDVARRHGLVDRHLAEDDGGDDSRQRQRHPAAREGEQGHGGRERHRQRQEDALERRAVDETPDGELRERATERDREGEDANEWEKSGIGGEALGHQFWQKHREGVEDEAGRGRDRQHDDERAPHDGLGDVREGTSLHMAGDLHVVLRRPPQAKRDADNSGNEEGDAPARLL